MLYPTSRPSQARYSSFLVCVFVHERPGPDHPKVPEVGIFPVERLVRRPVLQGCVRSPVSQVDCRVHQLPPKAVSYTHLTLPTKA